MALRGRTLLGFSLGLALVVTALLTALTVWVTRGGLDDWARRTLIAELERQTDVRADIGELCIHLFSTTVEARRLVCFLPGDTEPFLTADRLTAEIAVESLWRRRFSLRQAALDHPVLKLAFDERGFNLARIRTPPRRKRTLPQEPDESLVDETFHGGRIVVRDGVVRLGAAAYGVTGQVTDFRIFGYTGNGKTVNIEARFDHGHIDITDATGAGRALDAAQLRLAATVKREAAELQSLVVTTPFGELTAAGAVSWPGGQVRYTGNAYLTLDLAQAGQRLLGGLPLQGRVQMPARFGGDLANLTLEGHLEPLTGQLFDVAVTGLTADYWLAMPFGGFPSRAETDVKASRVALSGNALDGFSAHVSVSPTFVDVTELTGRIWGGQVRGQARLAYLAGARERSTAKLTAEGLEATHLLRLARLPQRGVTGRSRVQADLSWPGLDTRQVQGRVQAQFTGQSPPPEGAPDADKLPLTTEARVVITPGVVAVESLVAHVGQGTLTGSGRYRWRARAVEATLDYHTPEVHEVQILARRLGLTLPASADQTADTRLEVYGTGDITATVSGKLVSGKLSALTAAGTASVGDIRVNDQHIGRAAIEFETSPTGVIVREASLVQPDGGCLIVAFDSGWTDNRPTRVKLDAYELKLTSLGAIARAIPATKALGEQLSALGGRADGKLALTGLPTLKALQVGLSPRDWVTVVEQVRGGGTLALTMVKTPLGDLKRGEARVVFQDNGLTLKGLEARFPSGVVTGYGSYRPADGAYSVTLRSDGLDVMTLARAVGRSDLSVTGLVTFDATSTSTVNRILSGHLDFALQVGSDKLTVAGDDFTDVRLTAASDTAGEQAAVRLAARYRDYTYYADATVTYLNPDGELALLVESQFDFDQTPLTPVLAVFDIGPQNLRGDITGRLRLSGPLYSVDPATDVGGFTTGKLTLTGDIATLRLIVPLGELGATVDNYIVVNDGPLRFSLSDRALDFTQFHLKDEQGDTTSLNLSGRLGLTGGRDVITAEGRIDLKLLRAFSRRVTSRGLLTIKAKITGSLLNPRLTGYTDIDDFGLRITEFPLAIENGGGRILFNANRAQIETLTADAGGGKIEATGGAVFERLTDVRWRFGLRAENIRVKYPRDIRSLADGDLILQGNRSLQVLSGVVRIKRAEYTTNTDLATLVRTQFIGLGGVGTSLQTRDRRSTFTTLDVRVEAPDTLFIRNNIADVVGSASLRLRGSLDNPDVSGRILITRGQLEFRNDRFEVTRGVVSLPEGPTGGTFYDIQAEATIQGYRIIVGLTGTADNFNPILRSEPNLPQSSILSLLATGRLPPPEIANTMTAAQQANISAATTLLSELLTERIEEQTGRLFGINRFQIDPLLVGRGGDPTARLTVGRRITKDLTVTFSTNLATAEEQIILIEYRLRNNLSIIGLRDQQGNFGFDVRVTKRF